MSGPRIVSVVGRKNSGKTTLVVALASGFVRRGKKVSTIKHGTHHATVDSEGTDTWRHKNEGNATGALLEGPGERVLFQDTEGTEDPVQLARRFFFDCDLVIAEGFTSSDLPKVEIYRSGLDEGPLFREAENYDKWIALVADTDLQANIPVFQFSDTAWLVTLSKHIWANSLVL